jgi:hypothetical protein
MEQVPVLLSRRSSARVGPERIREYWRARRQARRTMKEYLS